MDYDEFDSGSEGELSMAQRDWVKMQARSLTQGYREGVTQGAEQAQLRVERHPCVHKLFLSMSRIIAVSLSSFYQIPCYSTLQYKSAVLMYS